MCRGWRSAVCVASGPSFTEGQAARISEAHARGGPHVIVVNDNWIRLPGADVLYAADFEWWKLYSEKVKRAFYGELWTTKPEAAADYGLHFIESIEQSVPLPFDSKQIARGSDSGFQALMLARVFGARHILLVGYDMQRSGGRKHWFGDHPKALGQANPLQFVPRYDEAAPALAAEGTDIINCSTATALQCFRRGSLDDELRCCT